MNLFLEHFFCGLARALYCNIQIRKNVTLRNIMYISD